MRQLESEMDRGAFVRRDLAKSTALREFIERYAAEVVPDHWGRKPETLRCVALATTDLARCIVATLRRGDFKDYARARLKLRKRATVGPEIQLFHAVIKRARN